MISKHLKIIEKKELCKANLGAVWCNIYTAESRLLVGSVYIPPGYISAMKEFFTSLDDTTILQQEQ